QLSQVLHKNIFLGPAKLIKNIDSAKMLQRGLGALVHLITFASLFQTRNKTKVKHGWQYHFHNDQA
ncbi:MAG: hypothetical protein AAFZ63_28780, partial [Bacteroidota bacterium]